MGIVSLLLGLTANVSFFVVLIVEETENVKKLDCLMMVSTREGSDHSLETTSTEQGTGTVRTEESMHFTLINVIRGYADKLAFRLSIQK